MSRLEAGVAWQARLRPGATAVVEEGGRVTYGELERRSNGIARALFADGVRPRDRVCLLMPKSADSIAAILGVLKVGGVYTPLDPSSPGARLAEIIRSLQPGWLIVDPGSAELVSRTLACLEAGCAPDVLWLGAAPHTSGVRGSVLSPAGDDDPPALGLDAQDALAYVLFTSGSTGRPKGVPITHDGVAHLISWANEHFGIGPDDRLSAHSPLQFDMSVWDMFAALTAGAELHLVPPSVNLLPSLTARFIRERGLTQWASVASVLTAMAGRDVLSHGDFPDLRRVIWSAEVLPVPVLRYWMERLPHVRFANTYGPTETTIIATHHTVTEIPPEGAAPVPIGVVIPGKKLRVVDESGDAVSEGEIGELWIGGRGVSPGYWDDPERATAAFVHHPPGSGERWYRTGDRVRYDADGFLHFHGRSDRQVKTRGYRVELDEIAGALVRVSGVAEGAVVAVPAAGIEGMRLCAAYVPELGVNRSPHDLRRDLGEHLPAYMLPARWLALDALPLNRNGKVDHRALEDRFAGEDRATTRSA